MRTLLLAALAATLAAAAPAPAATPMITAIVVEYGPMPSAGSGVLKVLRPVIVVVAKGARQTLYFIHGSDGHYLAGSGGGAYPAIGSACSFSAGPDREIQSVSC